MSYDKNWGRWITASMLKYLDDNKPSGAFVYYEGQPRKTNGYDAWYEVRIDGPTARELSKDYWRLEIEVNILCSCGVDRDLYHIDRMLGEMGALLSDAPGLFKLGDGPDDDQSQLGCLTLNMRDSNEGIIPHKFGQIEPKTPLIQATIEAHYWINLP